LIDVIGREDRIAVFKYDSKLVTLVDFNQGHEVLDLVFDQLPTPGFSEANFYDALLETLSRMGAVGGRKAIIVISSGLDTFSRASYEHVLQRARDSATPIYTIALGRMLQAEAALHGPSAPLARIDWNSAEKQLEMLARESGARAYAPGSGLEIIGIYDDIMESLRVRYVIAYVSSNPARSGPPRQIRVELVDPGTGGPLKIRDANGKPVSARVVVHESYSPSATAGRR
jgi:VWFA-related protein